MDTRDGRIYSADEVAIMPEAEQRFLKPMVVETTRQQRLANRVGRNDPCPCGSGQKFKRCCLLRRFTPGV